MEKVAVTACRSLGPEFVANNAWDTLSYYAILKEARLNKKDMVLAKVVILSRLISPCSKLASPDFIKERSSIP